MLAFISKPHAVAISCKDGPTAEEPVIPPSRGSRNPRWQHNFAIAVALAIIIVAQASTAGERPAHEDHTVAAESSTGFKVSAGYDLWYSMWDVETDYGKTSSGDDYNIDPALVHGLFATASSTKQSRGSWNLSVKIFDSFIRGKQNRSTKQAARLVTGIVGYEIRDDTKLLTQFQYAKFKGEFKGFGRFETTWTKVEVLRMSPFGHRDLWWWGWGVRYIRYSMPSEFTAYETLDNDEVVKVGERILDVDSQGVSLVLKWMEPMIFGYDDQRWYFLDADMGLGISFAKAKDFEPKLFGFQFNSEIQAGAKHTIRLGRGHVGLKGGYRLFVDTQSA